MDTWNMVDQNHKVLEIFIGEQGRCTRKESIDDARTVM